jgi:hypothetical protein
MNKKIVVIGGGPAGMMAAGRAGELGAEVFLLEKNNSLGIKLLITGKGRCNLTNSSYEPRDLVQQFARGSFLFSSLYRFGVEDTINFFESRGLKTKVERGNRVFPLSDRSQDVLNVLQQYLVDNQVKIKTKSEVKKVIKRDNKIEKIVLENGEEIKGDIYIIATGGKSYPATGSSGEAFEWLRALGHKVVKPRPALVPIILQESFIADLEGLSLKNVEISVFKDKKKIDSRFGEALFTDKGMSGPIILDMSREIGENLPGDLELKIDFKPALSFEELDKRVQSDFSENNNKLFRNSLDKLLPKKLIPIIIALSGIDKEKKVNLVTREERKKLIHLLKEFTCQIKDLESFKRAIITAGGVDLGEVDPRTCQSKLIENLYLVGEVLDLDGPTGGYNLQVCWSTGYVAGEAVST